MSPHRAVDDRSPPVGFHDFFKSKPIDPNNSRPIIADPSPEAHMTETTKPYKTYKGLTLPYQALLVSVRKHQSLALET